MNAFYSRIDFYIALLFSWVFLVTGAFIFIKYKAYKYKAYDEDKKQAEIEMMRAFLENKLYNINETLLNNETRWKDINHLLISAQKNKIDSKGQIFLTNFLKENGVTENDLEIDKDLVFVLTPFHEKYENVFNVIRMACNEVGLKCFRGDEQFIKSDLLPHILKQIIKARIIIANIDGRNPNVFYELGLVHAMDKGTILISSSVADLPFDLKNKKILIYKGPQNLQQQLKNELIKYLK